MKDMECRTFTEGNELLWDRVEWRRQVASNQSSDSMMISSNYNYLERLLAYIVTFYVIQSKI